MGGNLIFSFLFFLYVNEKLALMRSVGEILNDQQIQTLFSGGIDFNNFLNYFKNKWEKSQAYETLVNAFR